MNKKLIAIALGIFGLAMPSAFAQDNLPSEQCKGKCECVKCDSSDTCEAKCIGEKPCSKHHKKGGKIAKRDRSANGPANPKCFPGCEGQCVPECPKDCPACKGREFSGRPRPDGTGPKGGCALTEPGCASANPSERCVQPRPENCNKPCANGKRCEKGNPRQMLFKGITLSSEQQKQLDQLQAKQQKKADKNREKMRKAGEKSRDEFDKNIKKILTPEQYAQFKANAEKTKAYKGAKAHGCKKFNKGDKMRKGGDATKAGMKHPRKSNTADRNVNKASNVKQGPAPKIVTE